MKTIFETELKALGYNALYSDDCGCKVGDDFMPCGDAEQVWECEPYTAYKVYCTPKCIHEELPVEGDYHYQPTKPLFPPVDPFISFNHAGRGGE